MENDARVLSDLKMKNSFVFKRIHGIFGDFDKIQKTAMQKYDDRFGKKNNQNFN